MGLLSKAVKKKESAPKKPSKNTTWLCGSSQEDLAVSAAVHDLKLLDSQAKAINAKMEVCKTLVKKTAERNYIRDYTDLGLPPETPMIVQNADGEQCTYVVQDRSGQLQLKEDQIDQLGEFLGEDAANKLIYSETTFSLNRDVMAVPGVSEAIEKALEGAINELTKGRKPILSTAEAEALVDASQRKTLKPGTLDRLVEVCGKDATRVKAFLDIVGSMSVRYVRP